MMNLVSRCSERTSDVLASTASESPGKTRHESQLLLSSWNKQHQRTVRLVYEKPAALFTQHTDRFTVDDDDMDSGTVAESDMSLISRSFLHRVNDRVRKIFHHSSEEATQDSNKHCLIWEMFMFSTLEASVLIGKNYLDILHSIKTTGKDLTMKQMFDISEKLIAEQSDEIYGVNTINWCDFLRKHLTLIGDEEVVSLSHAKVYVFSDSVLCFGKMSENPLSSIVWEDKLTWFKSSSQYRALDTIDGEPMEFEWIFPGFTTLQLCNKVQPFLSKMSVEAEDFTGRIILMSMFNDISWGSKDNEPECELSAKLVSICAKRFSPGRWSFFGPGSEKMWYSTHESKPEGEWDRVAELMMIKCGESGHPVFRSMSPLSRGVLKSKGGGKSSIHFCADEGTTETVFLTIISVNQLSIYGAVSDLCEEYKTCHVRTWRPFLVGQSDALFVPTNSLMKTPTLSTDDLAQEDLCKSTKNEWKGYHNKIV